MRFRFCLFVGALCAILTSRAFAGNVNLEWRPVQSTAGVGDIVMIGLYAVSADGETNQSISSMDVIVQWDPSTLQLLGVTNNGPYTWLQSAFLPDAGVDGLNNTWTDGDALYTALGQFVTTAQATPAGLLITTFRFQAVSAGPTNLIQIPAFHPQQTQTVVFGADFVGQRVTGALGSAMVNICGAGAAGDMNGDSLVDADDLHDFVQAALTESTDAQDVCPGDFNHDGKVSTGDVAGMVSALVNQP